MNALQWIVKEAKHLRRKYPKRFAKWTDYVAEASAIYARKHKGKSPVGKKSHAGRYRKPGKVVRRKRRISNVTTASKSHTDKNRITANIQIGKINAGALKAELKKRIVNKIDNAVVRKYHAKGVRVKRKIQKVINQAKSELRKLC